jgi:hypothetical protein
MGPYDHMNWNQALHTSYSPMVLWSYGPMAP